MGYDWLPRIRQRTASGSAADAVFVVSGQTVGAPGGMTEAAELSRSEVRRALRALPPKRRRELVRAVREGRAVDDPRDAALAVAWARQVQAGRWPRWALPEKRPLGRRRFLWLGHVAWILSTLVIAVVFSWDTLGGFVRWLLVGVLAYGIVGIPWSLRLVLRTRWNAPEAERRNRDLLATTAEARR
jgi:hypothetical protein